MYDSQISILENLYARHGGCKCFFELKNGTPCQGWISSVEHPYFRFIDSGPMAGDAEILMDLNEITVDTLAFGMKT